MRNCSEKSAPTFSNITRYNVWRRRSLRVLRSKKRERSIYRAWSNFLICISQRVVLLRLSTVTLDLRTGIRLIKLKLASIIPVYVHTTSQSFESQFRVEFPQRSINFRSHHLPSFLRPLFFHPTPLSLLPSFHHAEANNALIAQKLRNNANRGWRGGDSSITNRRIRDAFHDSFPRHGVNI